ncbi:hypothetical protein S40288_01403 [Stachybotrys chartarum IBT 40288]|nr:hypothetical protein S40288_01403 [Stachybotrys chartarum IBT 40288]
MDGGGNPSQSRPQPDRTLQGGAPAGSNPRLPQSRRFDESWVEVASQPSSSSLSSIGDEIVTTGLRVGGPYNRRRRLQASGRSLTHQQTAVHAAGTSSQEEYDESESEEDRLLTSSTENVQTSPDDAAETSDADSDDGDNATALGRASDRPVFRPQPNAFSHPPSHLSQRSYSASSAVPSHPHSGFTRPSFSQRAQTRVHRGGPNFMSPSAREDNDAALRASLTTLLSCAAAARGLPKTKEEMEAQRAAGNGVGPSNQPMELRLVPESELMEAPAVRDQTSSTSPRRRQDSPTRQGRPAALTDKSKRPTSADRSPRATKKKRTAVPSNESLISPTLLTWVVSAGVVVLVSVVGFGAGYVIGRDVGRQENLAASMGGMGSVNDTSACGREVMRTSSGGLKRLRWADVGRSIVAQS